MFKEELLFDSMQSHLQGKPKGSVRAEHSN